MMRTLNVVLLGAFLASLGIHWAVRPRPSRPNREFLPEMVRTPRYNAYSANPNFADGKTLQQPVPGTIARGFAPLHLTAAPEDALRAGETLQNPVSAQDAKPTMGMCCLPPGGKIAGAQATTGAQAIAANAAANQTPPDKTPAATASASPASGMPCCGPAAAKAREAQAVARGAVVFSNFCLPCHGPTGRGDGLVVTRGYPGPPSLYADNARKMKDGQMFHILTYGQKNMPGYAAQLSREDRWNVTAYVRSLQAQAPAGSAAPATGSASASPAAASPGGSGTGSQPASGQAESLPRQKPAPAAQPATEAGDHS